MMKSNFSDLKKVITLIGDKKITRFNEIFQYITRKTLSDASKISYERMRKIIADPGNCRYKEIVLLSIALETLPLEIFNLLKNEDGFQKS